MIKYLDRKVGVKFILSKDSPLKDKEVSPEAVNKQNDPDNEFINELLDTFRGNINTEDI